MRSSPFNGLRGACFLAALVVSAGPLSVAAQYPSRKTWTSAETTSKHPSDPAAAVAYWMSRSKQVRVTLADQRVEFRSANIQADWMLVDVGDEPVSISYERIDQVEYRGSAWKNGALIGALVYGTLSILASISLVDDGELTGGEAVVGSVLGFGIGYAGGALIGSPFKQWNTVYAAPD